MKKSPLKPRPAGTALNSPHFLTVVADIAQCRQVQRQAFRDGLTLLELSSPVADDHRKLRRLTQCLGDIANALETIEHLDNLNSRMELRNAIRGLTANGFAWLESLEAK